MRSSTLVCGAGLVSAATLVGAFWFQFFGGLHPCEMCLWQRWPHVVVIGLAVLYALRPDRRIILLMSIALFVGAGLGLLHTGVEQGWWDGFTACSAGLDNLGQLSSQDLYEKIMQAPVVRCDQISWQFLGLSMASWNMLICLASGGLCVYAYASSSASQYR